MEKVKDILVFCANILEKVIAILLLVAVVVSACFAVPLLISGVENGFDETVLREILSYCFNMIIVIEFVRVLIKHTMGTVIEVLIFALARGLIVAHENLWEMIASIFAIAALLACRKYLFREGDMEETKNE